MVLALIALVVLFYVYYEVIGYYIQLGWSNLMTSRDRGERVDIKTPGGVHARLNPTGPTELQRIESDVEQGLGLGSGSGVQVFNVSRNL